MGAGFKQLCGHEENQVKQLDMFSEDLVSNRMWIAIQKEDGDNSSMTQGLIENLIFGPV